MHTTHDRPDPASSEVVPLHTVGADVRVTLPRRDDPPAPHRPGRSGPPDVDRLARSLARWYAEALAGRRDTRPLRDLLTPTVDQRVRCAVMREAARRRTGRPSQSAVVRIRSSRVAVVGDRYEATVVVDDGRRATAIVATIHRRRHGWTVSDLARPEDGVPALRPPVLCD